jgi:hypothetical protein
MFCPSCGFQDQTQSKFCKRCGTNLSTVTEALAGRLVDRENIDLTRQRAIEDALLIDALKRRRKLLTGGIISGGVGLAMMVMISVMEGPEKGVVGFIPFMIGLGLILSALLVYKPTMPWQQREKRTTETTPQIGAASTQALPPFPDRVPDSVTTETTRRLEEPPPPRRIAE